VVNFKVLDTLTTGQETAVPIVWEAGWAQEPVRTRWKTKNLWQEFNAGVQPIASHFTDSAIPAHTLKW
jgi:hypothetical protein